MLLLAGLLIAHTGFAGELVKNARMSEISNIAADKDQFEVVLSKGEGPCADKPVFFKLENQPDQSKQALDRAMQLAVTAFSMDSFVSIHNYADDDCGDASYIKIHKSPR